MNQALLDGYILISITIAITDAILSIKSMQKNKTTGRYLGLACAGAAVVDISYLISILYDNYFCVSVMSSIYFISIDFMLICLLIFTVFFTKTNFRSFPERRSGWRRCSPPLRLRFSFSTPSPESLWNMCPGIR